MPASTWLCLFALALAPALAGSAWGSAQADSSGGLAVSPLLVDAAAEVWSVVARPDNPIWPGWNASDTPLLLYLPDRQDLLIGHPNPPEGFVRYDGPLRFPGGAKTWVKHGPTLITLDGQNTSRDVGGVRTLVVADPLSNLRQNLRALLEDPRAGTVKAREMTLESLAADPYDQLGLIVHEAFHVYQDRTAPNRGMNAALVVAYPVLSVDNNVGMGLEASALTAALGATDQAAFREAAVRWLAVRDHRRALLPTRARSYEDGVEFSEGLAKYTEYKLWQVLEGKTAFPGLERAQGFRGYRDLAWRRNALLDQMTHHLRGEVNVNNAPYGTAPLQMRLYYSGMAIGALLDRLSATWKRDVFTTDSSLTALARAALRATPAELESAWQRARTDTAYATLLAAKRELATAGARDAARRVAAIEHGPGTGIEIDYSRLGSNQVGFAFTPFGITSVDSARTIFDQVPITARFPDGSLAKQTIAMPLLRDSRRRSVRCRIDSVLTAAAIDRQLGPRKPSPQKPAPVKLELPGLSLDLHHAVLDWREGTLYARLYPDSASSPGAAH